MKNILARKSLAYLLVAAFTVYVASSCGSHDYLSKNFENFKKTHHTIAVLPFDVHFDNLRNQRNQQQPQHRWTDQERQGSLDMQKDLFVYLAKQIQKGHYELAVQDFNKTNRILQENNIFLPDITVQDKGKLAQLLGVDAVIWGQTDVRITRMNRYSFSSYGRNNDGVETTASIFDAASGEIVWSTNQIEHPSSYYNTPHDLADRVMDYVARRLPYRVAKR